MARRRPSRRADLHAADPRGREGDRSRRRSRPVRLGGAPHRKCYYAPPPAEPPPLVCAPPQGPSIDALALYRGQLALVDTFDLNDGIGANGTTTEVRTEAVNGEPQRLIALLGAGEGDESWLGPSWSGGKLYFYEDSMGAGFVAYRFDPAHNAYASARAHTYLSGFSVVGERAYEATGTGEPEGVCGEEGLAPCVVRLSQRLALKPSRAPVHVP